MSGPDVFGLPHLSEDAVAAFADGVLSAAATARARKHCGECPECADAVRGQRETAMMLRAAKAPALPAGLLDRLSGLPMSAQLPPPRSGLPTVLGADGIPMFVAHNPAAGNRGEPDQALIERGGQLQPVPHPSGHRRGAMPLTILASAAAVLAAGTLGGQVSALSAGSDQSSSSSAVNAASGSAIGGLLGGSSQQPASQRSASERQPASQQPASQLQPASARTQLQSWQLLAASFSSAAASPARPPVSIQGLPVHGRLIPAP